MEKKEMAILVPRSHAPAWEWSPGRSSVHCAKVGGFCQARLRNNIPGSHFGVPRRWSAQYAFPRWSVGTRSKQKVFADICIKPELQ
jgi:hypothetical protein